MQRKRPLGALVIGLALGLAGCVLDDDELTGGQEAPAAAGGSAGLGGSAGWTSGGSAGVGNTAGGGSTGGGSAGVVGGSAGAGAGGSAGSGGNAGAGGSGCSDPVAYYADCDSDGYAAPGVIGIESCTGIPSTPACGASGNWTLTAPTRAPDCNDQNAQVSPSQTQFFGVPDSVVGYDYDCNGSAEKQYVDIKTCSMPLGLECTLSPGWIAKAPECGAIGTWVDDCVVVCTKLVTTTRSQGCR